MPISINDPQLETRLELLGQMQPVPVSKHAMAKAVLREATTDLSDAGGWKENLRSAGMEGIGNPDIFRFDPLELTA